MKCLACNRTLSDRESVRKYASTGTFVDLCNKCFAYVSDEIADIDDGVGDIPSIDDSIPETEITDTGDEYQEFRWGKADNDDFDSR